MGDFYLDSVITHVSSEMPYAAKIRSRPWARVMSNVYRGAMAISDYNEELDEEAALTLEEVLND